MARRKKGNPVNGWINLYKPLGMTSNQALGAVKRALNPQKAGHAGTLDPLASGILPIALGEATKTVPYVQDAMKSYRFTVTWGEERTTDDAEGEVAATSPERPARAAIEALLPAFHGDVEQTPPQFSAIKINGARAYDIARGGEVAEIASRLVYIDRLEITDHTPDNGQTTFTCDCGKGTYVRAIARDLGRKLGCYGYVSLLERTAVGGMTLDNAISLDILQNLGDKPPECGYLMPLTTALDDIPVLALRQDEAARLKNGQALFFSSRPDFARLEAIGMDQGEDGAIALATFEGDALAMVALEGPEIKPVRLFNF